MNNIEEDVSKTLASIARSDRAKGAERERKRIARNMKLTEIFSDKLIVEVTGVSYDYLKRVRVKIK